MPKMIQNTDYYQLLFIIASYLSDVHNLDDERAFAVKQKKDAKHQASTGGGRLRSRARPGLLALQ